MEELRRPLGVASPTEHMEELRRPLGVANPTIDMTSVTQIEKTQISRNYRPVCDVMYT